MKPQKPRHPYFQRLEARLTAIEVMLLSMTSQLEISEFQANYTEYKENALKLIADGLPPGDYTTEYLREFLGEYENTLESRNDIDSRAVQPGEGWHGLSTIWRPGRV